MKKVGEISYEYKSEISMFTNMGITNETMALVSMQIKNKFEQERKMDNLQLIDPTITEIKVDGLYLIKGVSDVVLVEEDTP